MKIIIMKINEINKIIINVNGIMNENMWIINDNNNELKIIEIMKIMKIIWINNNK